MAESTVLGVVKTYNLCEMYVTVFDLAVNRQSSEGGGHALFIGLIFIHADSMLETFP
jgi:hypothetical protein